MNINLMVATHSHVSLLMSNDTWLWVNVRSIADYWRTQRSSLTQDELSHMAVAV